MLGDTLEICRVALLEILLYSMNGGGGLTVPTTSAAFPILFLFSLAE